MCACVGVWMNAIAFMALQYTPGYNATRKHNTRYHTCLHAAHEISISVRQIQYNTYN